MNILIYNIAKFAIHITYLSSIIFLWNKNNLICYYLVGFTINFLVNSLLRNTIKQKRPFDDTNENDKQNSNKIDKQNSNENDKQNSNENDKQNSNEIDKQTVINDKNNTLNRHIIKYGMPSGHAQSTLFSAIYISFSLKNIYISSIFFIISFIAVFQRVYFGFHSIEQVIIGGIIGSFLAYCFYKLSFKNYFSFICKKWFLMLVFGVTIYNL